MLLDRLELQMYNAYEGCATNAMPSVPRSSLAFFRTNKKTCKDYFAKIRPMIIQCAKRLGEYHLLIRNTMEVSIKQNIFLDSQSTNRLGPVFERNRIWHP